MNTKEGYAKKSLSDARLLLAHGGDTAIRQSNTAYISETNITVRDVTTSDFTKATIYSVIQTQQNSELFDAIILKDSSNNIITNLPNNNSIYRIATSEAYFTAHPNNRAVFSFGGTLISIVFSGKPNDPASRIWMYLDGFPLLPNASYYFKFLTVGSFKYAYYLGTDIKFLSSTAGAALNGLSDVTISNPITNQVLVYNGSKWVNGNAPSNQIATSWADSSSVKGVVSPTLTGDKPEIHVPKEDYVGFPVMQDSGGNLWVALPRDILDVCKLENWDVI